MIVKNKTHVPQRERNGLTSHILLQAGDIPDAQLAATWVEVIPGAQQRPHNHEAEQVYIIVQGSGLMQINDETQPVTIGDLVYIPSNARHGIQNTGSGTLIYVSAATPNMDITTNYDYGQLANHPFVKEN